MLPLRFGEYLLFNMRANQKTSFWFRGRNPLYLLKKSDYGNCNTAVEIGTQTAK